MVGAERLDLLLLQHPQQLGLQRQRQVADLVEEQGAAVGNLLERAQLDAEDGQLDAAHLAAQLEQPRAAVARTATAPLPPAVAVEPLAQSLASAERGAIARALAATGGNRARAAARLGISRAALYNKLALHRLG
ncbi:hypothetical protein I0D00_20175 [Pseudomonas lalucatii]|uniref:DNA binding HTH domain-containing protein n=1 Tax=Pseudomonas lalucatii TaxID=1424203 RepID=A0ABS5Q620_9PSED|nr:hypothetical protein [Pseudomonas lalucatii]